MTQVTVIDRLAEYAVAQYTRLETFDEMDDYDKDLWRKIVRTVLEEAITIFLEQKIQE